MKRLLLLIIVINMLCGCSANGGQEMGGETVNYGSVSQQSATNVEEITQTETEPDYKDTNFIAKIPQEALSYTIEEITLNEAAESSGYSVSDSEFRCSNAYTKGDYIVMNIIYSNFNSSNFCAYNVIYDFNSNMVANISNIATEMGYKKSGQIRGIYGDYTVLCLSPESSYSDDKYFLYNINTKEIKEICYDIANIDEGVIIVGNDDPEQEYGYKYGALDLDFNEIIPIEYDELELASTELFNAEKDGKFGLIDFSNQIITDFKYKEIIGFIGFDKNESSNLNYLMDFEKNINKYAFAINQKGKEVLIDTEGAVTPLDTDMFDELYDDFITYGRRLSQHNNITYINNSTAIIDLDGNILAENLSRDLNNTGFINGYCITKDSDTCSLIDTEGKAVYTESLPTGYESIEFSPVDQNGLFLVRYRKDSLIVKSKIMDLAQNEVYTSDNSILAIGNGVFTQIDENNNYSVFRVRAN